MNKKILMSILPLVLGLIVVNAVLVGYLSNQVKAEVEVTSPMIAGISLGESNWGGEHFPTANWNYNWDTTLEIPGIHGGESITLYTLSENIADVEITGFEEAIVSNPKGLTCADFESVKVRTDSIYGGLGYGTEHELIPDGCHVIDDYHVWFGSESNSIWGSGEADVTEIVVTFKTDAIGTYTFIEQVIPAE